MSGVALLKTGGRLVYSTCSLNPVEDEAVVGEVCTPSSTYFLQITCKFCKFLLSIFSESENWERALFIFQDRLLVLAKHFNLWHVRSRFFENAKEVWSFWMCHWNFLSLNVDRAWLLGWLGFSPVLTIYLSHGCVDMTSAVFVVGNFLDLQMLISGWWLSKPQPFHIYDGHWFCSKLSGQMFGVFLVGFSPVKGILLKDGMVFTKKWKEYVLSIILLSIHHLLLKGCNACRFEIGRDGFPLPLR